MRNAELVADRLVVQSGSNHSGHRAADLAPWHSSVVQMSASPRVIRPRAWPDWSLHSARSTARCLSGVSGAGREPDATIVLIARPHRTAPHRTAPAVPRWR